MSTTQTKKKRHPLRKLFLLGAVVGIAVAVKNAIADRGGSYDAPVMPAPKFAAAPAPSAAEPTVAAETEVAEPAVAAAPFPAPPATRVQTAEEVLKSQPAKDPVNLADPVEAPKEAAKKIDPFGPQ